MGHAIADHCFSDSAVGFDPVGRHGQVGSLVCHRARRLQNAVHERSRTRVGSCAMYDQTTSHSLGDTATASTAILRARLEELRKIQVAVVAPPSISPALAVSPLRSRLIMAGTRPSTSNQRAGGQLRAKSLGGLYQVHGNAWDWTQDCWIQSNSGNPGDGIARTLESDADYGRNGHKFGNCNHRVLRGGSWNDAPWALRAASER